MTDINGIVDQLRGFHRQRRFAMKVQQKLDRALESFLRVHATDWDANAGDAERERANREVRAIIARVRAGDEHQHARLVVRLDASRQPWDELRDENENAMECAAKTLPIHAWVESVRGAGALGLATIVAEAGDLSKYPTPAHLWSRLGYAPYDGCAGSTWKRASWRPRALSNDEWRDHPFNGQRYALMVQIATWLVNAQWIGAAKVGNGEGKPNGLYGGIYAKRRAHTAETHPDWSKGHRRSDALRVTMKAFLKDLRQAWLDAAAREDDEHRDDHRDAAE